METQAKTLDTEMQRLKGQMVAKLDGSCMAMGEYGGTQYTISYNPVSRTGITKDNLQKPCLEYCLQGHRRLAACFAAERSKRKSGLMPRKVMAESYHRVALCLF